MILASTRFALLFDGVLAATLVLPCLVTASWIRRRLALTELFLFAITLLVIGVAAEAAFFLTMVSTAAAIVVVRLGATLGAIALAVALRDGRFRDELRHPDSWGPFAAAASTGFAFLAIFCIALPDDTPPLSFARTWLLHLPDDNMLPHLLATHIARHVPPKPFFLEWLSSDRPPLQAGFDLLLAALTPFVRDSEARYQALSMLLQTTSLGLMFTLCRLCKCTAARAGAIIFLSWLTGFFLINAEYVWPKLLAGAFVAVAVAIWLAPGLTWERAMSAGAATALGLLSHGGVIFTLPALIVAVVIARRRYPIASLGLASSVLIVVYGPWIWYQKVYDPPGDRLLKWHLAGQIAPTDRSFQQVLYAAYTDVPAKTIIGNKISNIETLFDTTLDPRTRRLGEFFHVGDAMGALALPFVAALFFARTRKQPLRLASRFAWISVGSLSFWSLALYLPDAALVHVGSELTMMLMFVAAGIIVTQWPPIFVAFLLLQAFDFAAVWLTPLDWSGVVTLGGGCALFLLGGIGGACCAGAVKPLFDRFRRASTVIFRHRGSGERMLNGNKMIEHTVRTTVLVLFALVLPTAIVLTRHAGVAAVSPLRVAAIAASLPDLARMRRRPGRATMSFDAVVLNGRPTIVAGLKRQRAFRVDRTDAISFNGWAFDPAARAPAAALALRIGARYERTTYGTARPDVAATFRNPRLKPVGFSARMSGSVLRRGRNAVSVIVISPDRKSYYVDPTHIVLNLR